MKAGDEDIMEGKTAALLCGLLTERWTPERGKYRQDTYAIEEEITAMSQFENLGSSCKSAQIHS